MNLKRRFYRLIICGLFIAFLTACGGGADKTDTKSETGSCELGISKIGNCDLQS